MAEVLTQTQQVARKLKNIGESVKWTYYSIMSVVTGAQTLKFFAGKEAADSRYYTNFDGVKAFPDGLSFRAQTLRFIPINAKAIDVALLLRNSIVTFTKGPKTYCEMLGLFLPPGVGLTREFQTGNAAPAAGEGATGVTYANNGIAALANVYRLDPYVPIGQRSRFTMQLDTNAANVLSVTTEVAIAMDGLLVRETA